MPIPLSAVISTVAVLLVVIVAIVTLTISLTSGLAALRHIAQGYAHALLSNAIQRTESIFTSVGVAGATFSNVTSSSRWPWPSDDSGTLDTFVAMGLQCMLSIIPSGATGLVFYYWDNTRITYQLYNATTVQAVIIRPSSYSAVGENASAQTIVDSYTNFYDLTAGALKTTMPYALVPTVENRFRSTSSVSTLALATVNGMRSMIAGYFVRSNNDSRGVYSEKYLTIIQPIYRAFDKPGMANIFGFIVPAFAIDDISTFLEDTRATPGTQSFAIDNGGYLLGSSMSAKAPFLTESYVPAGTLAGLGCATSETVGALSTGPNVRVCRSSYTTYPFAPLANLDVSIVFTTQLSVTVVDSYYAAAGPVKMPYPGMQVTIVLLMPEEDVIGDVVASRNTAIGVSAAFVVLAGVTNFVVVLFLLKPLHTIAERMHKASNLEDDETDTSLSAMSEVCALQTAYYEMNDELNRIRSFVPQSVLQAKKKKDAPSSDDDGGEGDLESLKHSGSYGVSRVGSLSIREANSGTVSPLVRQGNPGSPTLVVDRHNAQDGAPRSPTTTATTSTLAIPSSAALRITSVTCLIVNFTGFSAAISLRGAQVDKIASMVTSIFDAIKAHGGVLGSFHGDHFVASFNAVTRCASHAASACAAAVKIRDTAHRAGFGLEPRIGVATSRCTIGNAGSADAKSFCIIGAAFQQAAVLERLVKVYTNDGRGILASYRTCVDVATQYRLRYVDIVVLPGGERSRCSRTLIAFVRMAKNATIEDAPGSPPGAVQPKDNEWLYLVADGDKDDEYCAENDAFIALYEGRLATAQELAEQPVTSQDINTKSRLKDMLARLADQHRGGGDLLDQFTDLGEYYSYAFTKAFV